MEPWDIILKMDANPSPLVSGAFTANEQASINFVLLTSCFLLACHGITDVLMRNSYCTCLLACLLCTYAVSYVKIDILDAAHFVLYASSCQHFASAVIWILGLH